MILEVPILNEDGSIKFTCSISAEQAQFLLQFAVSFLMSRGIDPRIDIMPVPPPVQEETTQETKSIILN